MANNDAGAVVVPRIQLLSFDGCPLAGTARAALERALTECGLGTKHYESIDILDSATPECLAGWGSPTILVDGKDVSGHDRGEGVSCRIYDTADQVPSAETIAAAIRAGLGPILSRQVSGR